MRPVYIPLAGLFIFIAAAHAQTLQDEHLVAPVPDGFMLALSAQDGTVATKQMVPSGETIKEWSRMITVQTFRAASRPILDRFATDAAQQWKTACPDGDAGKFKEGVENGYAVLLWMLTCPLNPLSHKPENMWLKVISGNDGLYSVQYAYRKKLSRALLRPVMAYLRQVIVCDPRISERPCHNGM